MQFNSLQNQGESVIIAALLQFDRKQLMKKTFIMLAILLSLTSCSLVRVHKMNIEQGNAITPAMSNQLHTGMSEEKVREIMGPPMLINTFDTNRLDYVYTFKPAYGKISEQHLTLIFKQGILREIKGNAVLQ